MKKRTGKLLAGIAITGAFCYKVAKNMGIIDKLRYKDEYKKPLSHSKALAS